MSDAFFMTMKLVLECDGERILHLGYIVECKPVEVLSGDFLDVAAVVVAEDDVGDVGTFGSKDFFFDTAHCCDGSAEGYFACHGNGGDNFSLGEC